MSEGTVTLADGRRIGYAEYGAERGIPVLHHHGLPGSRYYQLSGDALRAAGARLVTLERPGFGLSDPNPGRTLLDWPRDLEQVADALGLGRFAVCGMSAGGPNALACAYALPDRVAVVGLACALGPVFDFPHLDPFLGPEQQALLPIARDDRDTALALARDFLAPMAEAWAADPAGFFEQFLASWSEVDRPRFVAERERWEATLAATYGRGVDTAVEEIASTMGPWGFDAAGIGVPVHVWHGLLDGNTIEVARFVAGRIPGATLTEYEGEAHYLDESHHDEWLAALTAWAR